MKRVAIRGRNLITGLPEEITVSRNDIKKAMEKSVNQIVSEIKNTIEITPPELISDVMKRGICLAGGGALLGGLDILITKETGIPAYVIEDPMTAVARGAGIVLEDLDQYAEVLVESEELNPPR
jgi:rod shape-determining protein MreB